MGLELMALQTEALISPVEFEIKSSAAKKISQSSGISLILFLMNLVSVKQGLIAQFT
jgi:hypothetical protein